MTMTAIIKALTTKAERNYLKHNYRFMVGDEKEFTTTSESESEGYAADDHITSEFKVGHNLLYDVRKKGLIKQKFGKRIQGTEFASRKSKSSI